jgi:hypothetical protein
MFIFFSTPPEFVQHLIPFPVSDEEQRAPDLQSLPTGLSVTPAATALYRLLFGPKMAYASVLGELEGALQGSTITREWKGCCSI